MIVLPCRPSDSLDWSFLKIPLEGPLLWRFDLGLEDPFFPLDDEIRFQSLALSLRKFSSEIWPVYQERTKGAILYQGSIDFSLMFAWTERQLENLRVWEGASERLFCADAFVHYFQMLSHNLPDEMAVYLFLDATDVGTLATRHQLLSLERFSYFVLATKGLEGTGNLSWEMAVNRSPQAICLPEEKSLSDSFLQRIQAQMDCMEKPFRVISETFLIEEWEGVDVLYVFRGTLSAQGERKIKGFLATGGEVCYV